MLKDSQVSVEVKGPVNSGKSLIGMIIRKALEEHGVVLSFGEGSIGTERELQNIALSLQGYDISAIPKPSVTMIETVIGKELEESDLDTPIPDVLREAEKVAQNIADFYQFFGSRDPRLSKKG